MSRTRDSQPVLADFKVFVIYRWLSWLVAGVAIVWQGAAPQYVLSLMIAALVNLFATFMAQAYVRVVQKTPALLSLDVVYCAVLLWGTSDWAGPMALHALSALVLPALLYGWRGGLMSGLLFVSLDLALHVSGNTLPTKLIEDNQQMQLLLMLTVAPLFGCCVPSVVDMIRRVLEQRHEQLSRSKTTLDDARPNRPLDTDAVNRIVARTRAQERRATVFAELQPTRSTAVRTAEPSIEELRRALFAPFPQADMDLSSILTLLVTRFSDQTGTVARVTLLGRARGLAYAQRTVILRLAQEALLNVQQHAHASKVELTLRYDTTTVALLVQDDGAGLLDNTIERPGLHALRAMQYRLTELGGRLDVFETQTGGVTVRATAPLV